MTASTKSPRMTRWLIVGLITGLAIAMMGLIREQAPAPLPEDLIARAAGQDITRTDYEAALRAVAADKRGPLSSVVAATVGQGGCVEHPEFIVYKGSQTLPQVSRHRTRHTGGSILHSLHPHLRRTAVCQHADAKGSDRRHCCRR